MQGLDPVANGQTTAEEIERCQADPEARLKLSPQAIPQQFVQHKGPRYTPISKRQDKPDAISYLLRNHPELSDAQISKLIGTTKPTIAAVRDRTHWNSANIKPRHPVGLGLCTLDELDAAVARSLRGKARPAEERAGSEESEPVERISACETAKAATAARTRETLAGCAGLTPATSSDWLLRITRARQRLADFRQDRRIVDRRRHAVLLAVGDPAHRAAQDLAGAGLRQALDDQRGLEAGDRPDALAHQRRPPPPRSRPAAAPPRPSARPARAAPGP